MIALFARNIAARHIGQASSDMPFSYMDMRDSAGMCATPVHHIEGRRYDALHA
ncbi:hypothetical protein [Burkholderia sp. MSMB1459WGS]|uniref:hypothetical protein n=1 Tax=Burkholderia sp. MSMB1459WGS TaxID=1637970 RepID=UPI000A7B9A99|nr:hypothetical protein [Burkholderia sp. MSMB1459WGS]